jgi:hypothetical protein
MTYHYQVVCAKCGTVGYQETLGIAREYALKHDHGYIIQVHDTKAKQGQYDLWELKDRKLVVIRKLGLLFGDYIYLSARCEKDVCLQHRRREL